MRKHRKLISVVIAVFAAMLLWAYTVVYVSPKSSMDFNGIPITLRGDDVLKARGLILTSGREQEVGITVNGNRTDLLKLSSENIKVAADLSNITGAGSWDISYSITYPDTVANGDLAVEERRPPSVTVEVSLATTKSLRPALNVTGEPEVGCLLDTANLSCDVESVTIFGPSDEVDPIKKVQVDVDVTGMNAAETQALPYRLLDENNNEVELSSLCTVTLNRREGSEGTGSNVLAYIPVLKYRQLYLRPNYENLPDGMTVDSCTFEPTKVTVVGDSEVLERQGDELLVDVDLSTITSQQGSWELPCVVSPESGLVVYTTADSEFDGINVIATVKSRPLPTLPTGPSTPSEPGTSSGTDE